MASTPRLRSSLILAFLFTSGATSLVYQLVWSRYLSNLLGNSGQAHSVVVATFMGGLALGAWLFGRRADVVKSPLALYGVLELGIAVYALVFPWVLEALGGVYLSVAHSFPESVRVAPRLLLAAASLLPPTLLMGGTLPALARHFASHLGGVEKEIAKLYAVNSLGAAFGAFLGGVRAVPDFGLLASSRGAALANLVLALGAIALARAPASGALSAEAAPASAGDDAYPARAVRAALVCVALTGFTSMVLEMSWIRVLTLTLGASTYAFTLILASFILGIGLGSFWLATRKNKVDGLKRLAWLQFAQLAAVLIAVPLYTRLPYHFWQARDALGRTLTAWPIYQGVTFAFSCAVLLVPTFFMGASFPAAARVATSSVRELGRQLGGVYLWNTVGTILGAALGGLWLMPAIGIEGNFLLASALVLATAVIALWFSPANASGTSAVRRLLPAFAGAGAVLLFAVMTPGWSIVLARAGTFRSTGAPSPTFEAFLDRVRHVGSDPFESLLHRDDTFGTITVDRVEATGLKVLRVNGKADASNSSDMETQVALGHFGILLHPREVKRVLIIGVGSGVTIGSVIQHDVERVDVVEISPSVIDAARLFSEENQRALDDPRVHVHVEDAKTFMALTKGQWDLIISEPSNPWVAGVSGLFTREFFEAAARHLTPDGVLVQWLHTYESSDELLQMVVRTMRQSFPHSTTWLGPVDVLFVSTKQPYQLDFDAFERRFDRPSVHVDLARVNLAGPLTVLGRQVHSDEAQRALAGDGPIITDDHNLLEFGAPVAFFLRGTADIRDERYAPGASSRLWVSEYLKRRTPEAEEWRALYRSLAQAHPARDPLRRGTADAWKRAAPGAREAVLAVAVSAIAQGDFASADAELDPLLESGDREADLLRLWVELTGRRLESQHSVFTMDRDESAELLRAAREKAESDPRLRSALDRLCELEVSNTSSCAQPPVITSVPPSSR